MALNFGNAATGAATGAGVGSFIPGIGTLAGGAIGGLAGLFGGGKSKQPKIKEYQKYTPQQQKLLNQYSSIAKSLNPEALSYLKGVLSDEPEAFEEYEAPALRQFNEEIIPSILERFAGAGALSSSGLNQTLGQAGQSLSEKLAAQRSGLRENALQHLLNIGGMGLQSQYTPYIKEGRPGLFESFSPIAGNILGGLAARYGGF